MRKNAKVRKLLQLRAEEIKGLAEQRAALLEEMDGIVTKADEEVRAMSDDEDANFTKLEDQVKAIDKTIEAKERAKDYFIKKNKVEKEGSDDLIPEERAFIDYIRGESVNVRADATNLTYSDNGAVIPSSIVNKIIEKVVDICPIYQMADRYNVGGTMSIPYYDETTGSVQMNYADEFAELTGNVGSFKSIQLSGFLAGALSLISKKLVNNSSFDVLNKVIEYMSKAISKFIERECLIGTDKKCDGMKGVTQIITATSATAIVADELIDTQECIPDVYQGACIWIMNKATRTAIRKLKDKDGNYILNKDVSAKWGYTLLGKDVYCSDAMSKLVAGGNSILYGDMSGLAVKVAEEASIEVLREKYATQHAIGVVAWMEIDTKVEDAQKLAKLIMAS